MSLEKQLNPIESDNLNNVFAVADVYFFSGIEQRKEKFEASVSKDDCFHNLVFHLVWKIYRIGQNQRKIYKLQWGSEFSGIRLL